MKISYRDKDKEDSLIDPDLNKPSDFQHKTPGVKPPRYDQRKTQLVKDKDLENETRDPDLNPSLYQKKKKAIENIIIKYYLNKLKCN